MHPLIHVGKFLLGTAALVNAIAISTTVSAQPILLSAHAQEPISFAFSPSDSIFVGPSPLGSLLEQPSALLVQARSLQNRSSLNPKAYYPAQQPQTIYSTYESLTTSLQDLAEQYPAIATLFSLGQSEQGRELWAMRITDNPDLEEVEPEFKYVSTMHGDEPVGTELCLYLIQMLLEDYATDQRIGFLVDNTDITIVPLMNPDGFAVSSRTNARGTDLNRAFPTFPGDYRGTIFDSPLELSGRVAEVQRVMTWSAENSFVLSANLHTGALVVNYPYDDGQVPSGVAAPSPDEDLFRVVSLQYSQENPPMFASTVFTDGVTNGSDWFRVTGGMQDWNYRYLSCMEVTLELSNIKRPSPNTLPGLWENNRESLLRYLEAVHEYGVAGLVLDRAFQDPVNARIVVEGNTQPVFTDPDVGDYYRLLLPGAHNLIFEAPGYIPFRVSDVMVEAGVPTLVDVWLTDGDLNGDGAIDAIDVQLVLTSLIEGETDPGSLADTDGGGVSATDLQQVVNRALGRD